MIKEFLPRSVLVADTDLYGEIANESECVDLLSSQESLVIPFSGAPVLNADEVRALRQHIADAGQLIPSTLLMQNPYENDRYEYADDAVQSFTSAKYHYFAKLAQTLGAKQVKFDHVKIVDRKSKTSGAVKLKGGAVSAGNANLSKELSESLTDRLEGEMGFPGSEPHLEEAISFLKSKNLLGDHQMRQLIEMRSGDNPIQLYKMTFNGVRESESSLKGASVIAAAMPVLKANIGTTFVRTWSVVNSVQVSVTVSF